MLFLILIFSLFVFVLSFLPAFAFVFFFFDFSAYVLEAVVLHEACTTAFVGRFIVLIFFSLCFFIWLSSNRCSGFNSIRQLLARQFASSSGNGLAMWREWLRIADWKPFIWKEGIGCNHSRKDKGLPNLFKNLIG